MPRRASREKRKAKKAAYDAKFYAEHKAQIEAKRKESIANGVCHAYINNKLRYKYDDEFHEKRNREAREGMRRLRERRRKEKLAEEEKQNEQNESA